MDDVRSIIESAGCDASYIELEITESAIIANVERTIGQISALKEIGVVISIDDFGTGYSSLSFLKRFKIDVLKIDQTFVRDMLDDSSDAAIIEAIINMAGALNLRLIAEGVEQQEQAQALYTLGCNVMQGYLFSRPLPVNEFSQFLNI